MMAEVVAVVVVLFPEEEKDAARGVAFLNGTNSVPVIDEDDEKDDRRLIVTPLLLADCMMENIFCKYCFMTNIATHTSPRNGLKALVPQRLVGLAKMAAHCKPFALVAWRGMSGAQDEMPPINKLALGLRDLAPEQKHAKLCFIRDGGDALIRQQFPSGNALVRRRIVFAHGEHAVAKEHALLRPWLEARRVVFAICIGLHGTQRLFDILIAVQFREDRLERCGQRTRARHAKRQTVCVSLLRVRILPQNHDAHAAKRRVGKGAQPKLWWRKDGTRLLLLHRKKRATRRPKFGRQSAAQRTQNVTWWCVWKMIVWPVLQLWILWNVQKIALLKETLPQIVMFFITTRTTVR